MLRYNLRYQFFLILSDAVLAVIALAISTFLRLHIHLGMDAALDTFVIPVSLHLITIVIWIVAYGQTGVYRLHGNVLFIHKLRSIVAGHTLATLLFLGALYLFFRDFSRLQTFYFVTLLFVFVLIHRSLLYLSRIHFLQHINNQRNVVIVGGNQNALKVGEGVKHSADAGLSLLGYIRSPNTEVGEIVVPESEIIGSIADLGELTREHGINEVVIAVKWFDQHTSDLVTQVMLELEQFPVNIRIAPDYTELAYFRAKPENFHGMTIIGLRETVLSPLQRIIKRLVDIVFSVIALVVLSPLFLIVAILIRRDSPGPAIFRQVRVGQHGKRFIIYKFRTMYVDADMLVAKSHVTDYLKGPDDPRVTKIGWFLRRTSIDELPQFLNVLKGDMSIVGPRPEVVSLASQYAWWQRKRFEVPQGITGWWQVNGRSDRPMQLNTEDDLYYVRNYSIWLDFLIILRTIITVFTRRGAY